MMAVLIRSVDVDRHAFIARGYFQGLLRVRIHDGLSSLPTEKRHAVAVIAFTKSRRSIDTSFRSCEHMRGRYFLRRANTSSTIKP